MVFVAIFFLVRSIDFMLSLFSHRMNDALSCIISIPISLPRIKTKFQNEERKNSHTKCRLSVCLFHTRYAIVQKHALSRKFFFSSFSESTIWYYQQWNGNLYDTHKIEILPIFRSSISLSPFLSKHFGKYFWFVWKSVFALVFENL